MFFPFVLLASCAMGLASAKAQFYADTYAGRVTRYGYPYYNGYYGKQQQPVVYYYYAQKMPSSVAEDHDNGGGRTPWWDRYFSTTADEREIFPEWFEVNDPKDCDRVPETVKTGRPRDLCGDGDLGSIVCLCLKRPSSFTYAGHSPSVYEPICGECRDPCALRFVPDTYPRRRDEDSEEDQDYDIGTERNNNRNRNRNRNSNDY